MVAERQAGPRRKARRRPADSKRPSRRIGPARAGRILDILELAHPEARCALDHRNPYELVVATILSAQCTDARVNLVTPDLFRRYPTPDALAAAQPEQVEPLIRSTGFFRSKAASLIGFARGIVERHDGRVPATLEGLVRLPGIGRKTANVVLGHAFRTAEGIAVDTHVLRVAVRLGLARDGDAEKVEAELMALLPRRRWTRASDLLIFHGRKLCGARRPACADCPVFHACQWPSRQAFATHVLAPAASPRRGGR